MLRTKGLGLPSQAFVSWNGYIESFNGRLRDECLNLHLFWSLTQPGAQLDLFNLVKEIGDLEEDGEEM
jgi:hypothetical protein